LARSRSQEKSFTEDREGREESVTNPAPDREFPVFASFALLTLNFAHFR
jgi:hypothetical protein